MSGPRSSSVRDPGFFDQLARSRSRPRRSAHGGRRSASRVRSACSPSCAASRSRARRWPTSAPAAARRRTWSSVRARWLGLRRRRRSAAAGAMELAGVQRPRGRDLATGIVLGVGLGVAALFFYLDTVSRPARPAASTVTILFGSIFAVSSATLAARRGVPAAVTLWRCSCSRSFAAAAALLAEPGAGGNAARGIPVRAGRRALPRRCSPWRSRWRSLITIGTILSHRAADRPGGDGASAHPAPVAGDHGRRRRARDPRRRLAPA